MDAHVLPSHRPHHTALPHYSPYRTTPSTASRAARAGTLRGALRRATGFTTTTHSPLPLRRTRVAGHVLWPLRDFTATRAAPFTFHRCHDAGYACPRKRAICCLRLPTCADVTACTLHTYLPRAPPPFCGHLALPLYCLTRFLPGTPPSPLRCAFWIISPRMHCRRTLPLLCCFAACCGTPLPDRSSYRFTHAADAAFAP